MFPALNSRDAMQSCAGTSEDDKLHSERVEAGSSFSQRSSALGWELSSSSTARNSLNGWSTDGEALEAGFLVFDDNGSDEGDDIDAREGMEECWRQACKRQRTQVCSDRQLVRFVASWGPQIGRLVDIRSATQLSVTYWLREDVRALCVFHREDNQVRIFACSQMERCEAASTVGEVAARQFFLDLGAEDLRCGVFVAMELFTVGSQAMQLGRLGLLRPQLLLLCRSPGRQRALLGALRTLMDELMLHETSSTTRSAFHQMSDRKSEQDLPSCSWTSLNANDSVETGLSSERLTVDELLRTVED